MPKTILRSTPTKETALSTDRDERELEAQNSDRDGEETKTARLPSPYTHPLKPEMWSDPYPFEFASGTNSREFVLERISKAIIKQLRPKNAEEWAEITDEAWNWFEAEEARRKQILLEKVITSEVEGDSNLIDYLEERIREMREQLQSAA